MDERRNAGYYIGKALGILLVSCGAICIAAITIAATAKLLLWLF